MPPVNQQSTSQTNPQLPIQQTVPPSRRKTALLIATILSTIAVLAYPFLALVFAMSMTSNTIGIHIAFGVTYLVFLAFGIWLGLELKHFIPNTSARITLLICNICVYLATISIFFLTVAVFQLGNTSSHTPTVFETISIPLSILSFFVYLIYIAMIPCLPVAWITLLVLAYTALSKKQSQVPSPSGFTT